MTNKWLQTAQHTLDPNDSLQSSYPVQYEGTHGFLVFSKQRMLFIAERGFISKSYQFSLNLSYENLSECQVEGGNGLVIRDEKRRTYTFTSSVKASIIKQSLDQLLRSKPRKVKAVAKAV